MVFQIKPRGKDVPGVEISLPLLWVRKIPGMVTVALNPDGGDDFEVYFALTDEEIEKLNNPEPGLVGQS